MSHTCKKKLLNGLAAALLSASAPHAVAAVIDYPNASTNAAPIILTNNSTQLQVLTGSATQSGTISETAGSFGWEKIGVGTLRVTGANTYSGGTTISAGTLSLGSDDNLGAAGSVLTLNGGTLHSELSTIINREIVLGPNGGTFDPARGPVNDPINYLRLNGSISGSGSLVKTGPGTLYLVGENTYTGGTVIQQGTLYVGYTGTSGSITGDIVNNGNLQFYRQADIVYSGVISGTGSLTHNSGGILILTGENTFTGGINLAGNPLNGRIQIGDGGTIGSVASNITGGGLVYFNRADAITYGGTIESTVRQIGAGTLTLSGASPTARVFVDNGALNITGETGSIYVGNASAGAPVSITSSGRLHGAPNVSGEVVVSVQRAMNLTLLPGSVTQGIVQGGAQNDTVTLHAGLNVEQAWFYGGGGTNTLILTGDGFQAFFDPSRTHDFQIRKEGSGNWGLSQRATDVVLNEGTLRFTGAYGADRMVIHGGTLSTNGQTLDIAYLIGDGGQISTSAGGLITGSAGLNQILGSTIVGSGSLTKTGSGLLALTANNTISGDTIINGGTLQLGNGGTTGTVGGNIVNNATLVFSRSDSVTHTGAISGTGSVTKAGDNTLILTGTNTYSGGTNIAGGTLNVNSRIGTATVANGATLSGTGTVGNTTVQAGGTLAPGDSLGPLTVNGNLTLASGAITAIDFTPTAADFINVSGSAGLGGTLIATASSGSYTIGQRYHLLTATDGVTGTFSSVTTAGLPSTMRGLLGYDANNVYLYLTSGSLASRLPDGANATQTALVAGIEASQNAGVPLNSGLLSLFDLSGATYTNALDLIAGRIGPNIASSAAQSFTPFLLLMQNQGVSGSIKPAQGTNSEIRFWTAAFGGHAGISANAATGAANLSSSNYGFAAGAETSLDGALTLGGSVAIGKEDFHSGNGTGDSTDVMLGAYARKEIGALHIAVALGYGWHDISTLRTVTVAGTDLLAAKLNGESFGGRIEAGYRLSADDFTSITPFAAFAGQTFHAPAYRETPASGSANFALSYTGNDTPTQQTEVGVKAGRNMGELSAEARLAWAHQLAGTPMSVATFQGLPGSSFQVLGVRAATDTALMGLKLQVEEDSGFSYNVRVDAQLGSGTTIYGGMGTLAWRW